MVRTLTFVVFLLTVGACSSSAGSNEGGIQVIAAAKSAMGGSAWDDIQIWHETGRTISPSGEVTRYEHWSDFQSLKTRNQSIRVSEAQYSIFDGHSAYISANANFKPRSELDANMMREGAYLACFGFFFPRRFSATFMLTGTRIDRGTRYDVVRVSPDGLEATDIWINHESHLIFRMDYGQGQFHTEFSNYRKVGAVTMPFVLKDSSIEARTESITFEPTGSTSFTMPEEQ